MVFAHSGFETNNTGALGLTLDQRAFMEVHYTAATGGMELFINGSSVWAGTTTKNDEWSGRMCIGTRRSTVVVGVFSGPELADVRIFQDGEFKLWMPIDDGGTNQTGDRIHDMSPYERPGSLDNANASTFWTGFGPTAFPMRYYLSMMDS